MSLTQHPLSAAFPALPPAEFDELCADIAANGLQQPIVIFESQVLDGWNRYRACEVAGIVPASRLLQAGVDPVAFVKSANGHRRHMSASQRSLAFATCDESRWAGEGRPKNSAAAAEFPVTTAQAAKEADVSTRTMSQAKAVVKKAAPEVVEAVKAGTISVETGAKVAQLPADEQGKALTEAVAHKPKKTKNPAAAAEFPDAAELREQLSEMRDSLKEATDDNASMAAVFEADDKLAAAMAQNKQLRAEIATLRERVNGLMAEKNEAIRLVKHWQRKAQSAGVPA